MTTQPCIKKSNHLQCSWKTTSSIAMSPEPGCPTIASTTIKKGSSLFVNKVGLLIYILDLYGVGEIIKRRYQIKTKIKIWPNGLRRYQKGFRGTQRWIIHWMKYRIKGRLWVRLFFFCFSFFHLGFFSWNRKCPKCWIVIGYNFSREEVSFLYSLFMGI